MSDEDHDQKTIKELIEEGLGEDADEYKNDPRKANRRLRQRQRVFIETFKNYDFTVLDKLLSMMDELKEADVTAEQILEVIEENVQR